MGRTFWSGYGVRAGALIAAVSLLTLLSTTSGFAHAQLVKSSPGDKAELKKVPKRVDLWFNELLDDNFNSIEILPAAELSAKKRPNLAKGKPKVDPADRTHLSVEVSALKPGKYLILYRVLSRDGHSAPGRVMFTILEGTI